MYWKSGYGPTIPTTPTTPTIVLFDKYNSMGLEVTIDSLLILFR